MRFGVSAGSLAPPGASVDDCLEVARLAEVLGFDSVWVDDHVAIPHGTVLPSSDGPEAAAGATQDLKQLEPLVMVNALAAATSRVEVGVRSLAAPYRHPAVVAKMLATADLFSEGRVVLGVGTGWLEAEFTALALPPDHFADRATVTDEYVRAIKELWTNTGPSNFAGRFVHFEDVGTYPKPWRKPHPPIVIADRGAAGMVRASRLGNGYQVPTLSASELAAESEQLAATCRQDRRDPSEVELQMTAVVRISQRAIGGERPPLSGSIEQIADDLRAYANAGLGQLLAVPVLEGELDRTASRRAAMQLFATELLPAFGSRNGAP